MKEWKVNNSKISETLNVKNTENKKSDLLRWQKTKRMFLVWTWLLRNQPHCGTMCLIPQGMATCSSPTSLHDGGKVAKNTKVEHFDAVYAIRKFGLSMCVRRFRMLGHVLRMPSDAPPLQAMDNYFHRDVTGVHARNRTWPRQFKASTAARDMPLSWRPWLIWVGSNAQLWTSNLIMEGTLSLKWFWSRLARGSEPKNTKVEHFVHVCNRKFGLSMSSGHSHRTKPLRKLWRWNFVHW